MRAMKASQNSATLLPRRFRMVLLHLAEEGRRDLDGIASNASRSMHALRTRMKNLRALLGLVKERVPKAARKSITASANALKDAFSLQRDAHVIAALRAEIGGRRQVASYQKRAGEKSADPADAKHKSLRTETARLLRLISKLELDGLTWEQVMDAYVRCYRAGRSAMKACLRDSDPDVLHKWRRPVKELFFQSHVLRPIEGMKRRMRQARRLGDRLGKLNDLHLLEKSAGTAGKKGILKRVAKRRALLKDVVFKLGSKLFASKPREVARELEWCLKSNPGIVEQCLRQA